MNIEQIQEYFTARGMTMPNSKQALDFAVTEAGEAMDAWIREQQVKEGWVRNNPDKQPNYGWELADCYQMLQIAAYQHTGKHLEELLAEKWASKGFEA